MSGRGGPYFISKSSTYRKQVGGTVTLSCQVDNLGKSLLHEYFIISSEHSASSKYKIYTVNFHLKYDSVIESIKNF